MDPLYIEYEKDYARHFMKFLTKHKQSEVNEITLIKKVTHKVFRSESQERSIVFRTMVCELFYNAIQMLCSGDIIEYTITFQNNKGITDMIIGNLDHDDDDCEISVCQVKNKFGAWYLNKAHVNDLYIANRALSDMQTVNAVMCAVYLDGYEPIITTSFIPAKRDTKY
jgi:hypothetical protein